MHALALVISVLAAGAPTIYVPEIVHPPFDPKKPVEVVSQVASADATELVVTLRVPKEGFSFRLDFAHSDLKRLKLVLLDIKRPDRLYYFTSDRFSLDLLDMRGVYVLEEKANCVILANARGIRVLAPGGKLKWIPPDEKSEAEKNSSAPDRVKPAK